MLEFEPKYTTSFISARSKNFIIFISLVSKYPGFSRFLNEVIRWCLLVLLIEFRGDEKRANSGTVS